jgi:hypothetical protein
MHGVFGGCFKLVLKRVLGLGMHMELTTLKKVKFLGCFLLGLLGLLGWLGVEWNERRSSYLVCLFIVNAYNIRIINGFPVDPLMCSDESDRSNFSLLG